MPFDAGMLHAVVNELKNKAVGGRVDKIYQPGKEEIVLYLRGQSENLKLLISATAGRARVSLTGGSFENPENPPMFCMLLRKHIAGGHILDVSQIGFDRVLEIKISSHDEMGYVSDKYIIAEIMGKYSNIIFLDENKRIIASQRTVDITSGHERCILPGFEYRPPMVQDGKINPLETEKDVFVSLYEKADKGLPIQKFLLSNFCGFSPLITREIAFRATKSTDSTVEDCDAEKLWFYFNFLVSDINNNNYRPLIIYDKENKPFEFSFTDIYQYGTSFITKQPENFSKLLDMYFSQKDEKERINSKAHDILQLLSNQNARINKKLAAQQNDLAACENREKYKLYADLITANIYLLKKGMEKAELVNYYDESGDCPTIEIELDKNLTPSQNAQKYYKKYNKLKSAKENLEKQILLSQKEIAYIDTVFESLTKAENEKDLSEIRSELALAGYGKKLEYLSKTSAFAKKSAKKHKSYDIMTFKTTNGYKVLCGKNNLQNDYITTTLAERTDYWFHVKNMPGSHAILVCNGEEPPAEDFTDAAMIAAYFSSGKKIPNVAVDYTYAKNVKKPSGAAPGYVIYETNYSAYVTADEQAVMKMKT